MQELKLHRSAIAPETIVAQVAANVHYDANQTINYKLKLFHSTKMFINKNYVINVLDKLK